MDEYLNKVLVNGYFNFKLNNFDLDRYLQWKKMTNNNKLNKSAKIGLKYFSMEINKLLQKKKFNKSIFHTNRRNFFCTKETKGQDTNAFGHIQIKDALKE